MASSWFREQGCDSPVFLFSAATERGRPEQTRMVLARMALTLAATHDRT